MPDLGGLGGSEPVDEVQRVDEVRGDRDHSPVLPPPLERGDPDLIRLEVDVARAQCEGFADPTAGERERARERLDGGLRVGADRGEEAIPFVAGEVLPSFGADELAGAGVQGAHSRAISSAGMTSSPA